MSNPAVERLAGARIPTPDGQFQLYCYANTVDDKEHLALVYGDISPDEEVLVRVHSECFTGDVIGSLRCDCGEQLNRSMRLVAKEGAGIILYLRQEGRGIGLLEKLKAYNLQDDGFDTVEANLELGHDADEREYTVAALILKDLGVSAVRLLTNNPAKIDGLERHRLTVVERIPLSTPLNIENERYLQTKVDRMQHLLELGPRHGRRRDGHGLRSIPLPPQARSREREDGRPFVTLSYAQSLDGSIAAVPGQPFELSGKESLVLTHRLRAAHDAILVGIGTVLSDDPRLTVRHAEGTHPRPVVLDTRLRMPPAAGLLYGCGPAPIIATSESADDASRSALEEAGATILTVPVGGDGQIDLAALLDRLAQMGHRSVMVEGGSEVITSFLTGRLVDHLVITLVNMLVGGMPVLRPMSMNGSISTDRSAYPRLRNMRYRWYGEDLVIEGEPSWEEA